MAKITMELRHLLEIMSNEGLELFDFDYPIADLTWKETFEELFKDYFYEYEIAGTPDYFKHKLKVKLKLLIPYYNELYNSKLFEINPLLTKKITETLDENRTQDITDSTTDKTTSNNTSNTTVENTDEGTRTDYPEHTIITEDLPSGKTKETSNGSTTGSTDGTVDYISDKTNTQNNTIDYTKVIEGFEGNQNELLRSYRENIININQMLINDLKTLFILVY